MSYSFRPPGSLLFIGTLIGGCGSSANDEIPDALLQAIRAGNQQQEQYPEGPYGGDVGSTVPNLCMQGWLNPKQSDYDPAAFEELCLADFFDPEQESHRLLLLNTAARWCGACEVEYRGNSLRESLSGHIRARAEDGLRALGTLFQDTDQNPATTEDATRWAKAFEVDFPFAMDDQFVMGAFASPTVQPFNMLVDTRDMTIVLTLQGDHPDTLWPLVDDLLAEE